MKQLFQETVKSIQDKTYGAEIIKKTPKSSIGYWLKYVLIFAILYAAILIVTLVYQIPQLPKIVRDNFPAGVVSSQNGQLTSTLAQKTLLRGEDFVVTFDPTAKVEDPANLSNGVLFTRDTVYFKSPDSPVQISKLSELPEFTLSRDAIVKWLTLNQLTLLAITLAGVIILGVLITTLYVLAQLVSMLLWSVLFWLLSKIFKKNISYVNIFKLVVYATVPWLIVSNIVSLVPSPIFLWLNLGLFIFFVYSWLTNIPLEARPKKVHNKA